MLRIDEWGNPRRAMLALQVKRDIPKAPALRNFKAALNQAFRIPTKRACQFILKPHEAGYSHNPFHTEYPPGKNAEALLRQPFRHRIIHRLREHGDPLFQRCLWHG